jgi:Uma2 family endonuclease
MSNLAESLDNFTYKDYEDWNDGVRYELIYGDAYMMSSPSIWHQRVVLSLGSQLSQFLESKPCEAFIAPFDVRLFPAADGSDNTVVQPDVFVVCDASKLSDGKVCRGAPDFVVEVVSSSSKMIDRVKKDLYCKAGVKEYWMIGPDRLYTYVLTGDVYSETVYKINSSGVLEIPVSLFSDCLLKIASYS